MKKETPYASTSSSRRILVVLALLLFIVALVLVIIQSATSTRSPVLRTYSQGFAEGYMAAREQAADIGLPPAASSNHINATITRVRGNGLEVRAENLLLDDSVDTVGLERTVSVTANTKIVSETAKDPEEFDSEFRAFQRALNAYNPASEEEAPEPPSASRETPISQTELSEGDRITIVGAEGEDLTIQKDIVAVKIIKHSPRVIEEPSEEKEIVQ